MMRRLLVEGWRFLPHSYALVAQSHCLCLLHRDDVALRFVDLPYYYDTWRRTRGVFTQAQEDALAALRAPESGFAPQVTYTFRPERPDFSAPASGRRFAFGTAEYRILTEQGRSGLPCAAQIPDVVSVVTPSRWTALAFERFGLAPERVHVVPHGIDPTVFRPDVAARMTARTTLGVSSEFVFMSIGAMTWNKGLDVLLQAFSRVVETEPNVQLFLKGADDLYPSREYVNEVIGDLPSSAKKRVADRLIYDGGTYPARMMADLLRAADAYVSPYRAEGFNMPVLEAAACGVPVICTGGGPTDEFTDESFAYRIRSSPAQRRLNATELGDYREPDVDHLVELMLQLRRERDDASRKGAMGAAYAARYFTWQQVTARLVAVLFGETGS
jgi:glycosyltransferase involved in cell wall biosynthesis